MDLVSYEEIETNAEVLITFKCLDLLHDRSERHEVCMNVNALTSSSDINIFFELASVGVFERFGGVKSAVEALLRPLPPLTFDAELPRAGSLDVLGVCEMVLHEKR